MFLSQNLFALECYEGISDEEYRKYIEIGIFLFERRVIFEEFE